MAKHKQLSAKYDGIIVSVTDIRKVRKKLNLAKQYVEELVIKQLTYIGEEAVRIARQSGSYEDITGNLRSSIGYVVLHDGKPVITGASEQYEGKKGDGHQGVAEAKKLLQELQGKFPWGIVLVVCAGMNYAAYVEAVHHKDVLTSAELKAEALVNKLLKGVIE